MAMLRLCKPILILLLLCGVATGFPRPSNAATSKQQATQPTDQGKTGKPQRAKSVVYKNKKYGFRFSLPSSWKGYSIVVSQWGGSVYQDQDAGPTKSIVGPLLTIRHPLWTETHPYQDIPIMILTHAQWKYVEEDRLAVSAAPIGLGEIGRNAKYVFALPPRFDYGDSTGCEEVQEILRHHPLHPF
jgi:hypothetical protein